MHKIVSNVGLKCPMSGVGYRQDNFHVVAAQKWASILDFILLISDIELFIPIPVYSDIRLNFDIGYRIDYYDVNFADIGLIRYSE